MLILMPLRLAVDKQSCSTKQEKEKTMLKENRVLSRQKAREVSQDELKLVSGNGTPRTLTACTFDEQFGRDGDTNEC